MSLPQLCSIPIIILAPKSHLSYNPNALCRQTSNIRNQYYYIPLLTSLVHPLPRCAILLTHPASLIVVLCRTVYYFPPELIYSCTCPVLPLCALHYPMLPLLLLLSRRLLSPYYLVHRTSTAQLTKSLLYSTLAYLRAHLSCSSN